MTKSIKSGAKIILVFAVLIVLGLAAYFEFTFRKIHEISGMIYPCTYADADFGCSYVSTTTGNFLLTQGSIDKLGQDKNVESLYGSQVKLYGRISRQKLPVRDLGLMNRFQVERWEFQ